MIRRSIYTLAAVLMLTACQEDAPQQIGAAGENDGRGSVRTAASLDSSLTAIGDSAAVALTTTLMARVQAEIERVGPAGAVSFCSEQALPLTGSVEDGLARGLALKRTSERVRNPANAPDSLERAALEYFASAAAAGETPTHLVQATEDGWRYYRPITVAPLCTTCHGPTDQIDPDVRRILAERYPQDQATGYSAGDFRGVVRVSIPRSAVVP